MKNKVYVKVNKKHYLPAVRRYLKFVFNIESSILDKKKILDNSIILIEEDASIDKEWLNLLYECSSRKIIILGLSGSSNEVYVNLLDLSHLKSNIRFAINRNKDTPSPFLLLHEVEQKMQLFFKGHGEESLFDTLNKTTHFISNGPTLFRENLLEWKEYIESYFNPGSENWAVFRERFEKYKIYLKVCGFGKEIEEIEDNINNFQGYIDELKILNKDEVKRMDEKKNKQNIDYLRQVDSILDKLKQKIDSVYHE